MHRLLTAFVLTGLLFMLLPGTFLGVWNLIPISSRQALQSLSPPFVQAHGHAQLFGWIGTFILGIGLFSTKIGPIPPKAIPLGWTCFGLWTSGVTLRWVEGVSPWHWRVLLPVSAFLELTAFLVFFHTVTSHSPVPQADLSVPANTKREPWMLMVMAR